MRAFAPVHQRPGFSESRSNALIRVLIIYNNKQSEVGNHAAELSPSFAALENQNIFVQSHFACYGRARI